MFERSEIEKTALASVPVYIKFVTASVSGAGRRTYVSNSKAENLRTFFTHKHKQGRILRVYVLLKFIR